jgi:hypothetical protein
MLQQRILLTRLPKPQLKPTAGSTLRLDRYVKHGSFGGGEVPSARDGKSKRDIAVERAGRCQALKEKHGNKSKLQRRPPWELYGIATSNQVSGASHKSRAAITTSHNYGSPKMRSASFAPMLHVGEHYVVPARAALLTASSV